MSREHAYLRGFEFQIGNGMNLSRPSLGEVSGLGATRARQRAIGDKLRELFDDVVQEPVPESFLDILRLADDGPGIGKA